MGYTHYWYTIPEELPKREWARFRADVKRILETTTVPLGDWEGEGVPSVNGNEVVLNGVGEDAYETFALKRRPDGERYRDGAFACCKTSGGRPYDAVVCAILLAAKVCFGASLKVSSDGDWDEWELGRALYQEATGSTADCPWEI